MILLSCTLSSLLLSMSSSLTVPYPSFTRRTSLRMSSEFDSILGEGTGSLPPSEQKSIIGLPDSSEAATMEMSSEESFEPAEFEGSDKFLRKKEQRQVETQPAERSSILKATKNYLQGKDIGELFFFAFVPAMATYWLGKKGYDIASTRINTNGEELLDSYANEMIYHDGDIEEMRLCNSDYTKKLMWMGPKRSDAMIKKYLELYAKKKTVSPQAISSLSYVFSMYKFSEDRAAKILSEICASMPEKVASAGKLLFFGEHIFKTDEGRKKLQPIKKILAGSYRDYVGVSGEEIVEKSQIAMGEAAYKSAVAAAGKNQTTLTVGWEVLGLNETTATEIWTETARDGFLSAVEAKYATGFSNQKFDKKGRKTSDDGELLNPEEADDDDDNDNDESGDDGTASVYECANNNCGYTLFVAKGRDFKFFGANFKCPECGAGKDKFVSAN